MNDKPYVGLTMGDPCGIGPEVVIKALIHSEIYEWCNPVIIGNAASLRQTVKMLDIDMSINHISDTDIEMSRVNPNAASVIDIGNLNYEDVTIGEILYQPESGLQLSFPQL